MTKRMVNSRPWKVAAVLSAIYLGTQVLPLTLLVFHPKEVLVNGQRVTLFRSFPADRLGLPRPRISYVEEVRPLSKLHNGGHACVKAGGPFRYSAAQEVGSWDIPWAAACLDDPRGFTWEATWTWHLGDMTFGPTSLSRRFLKENSDE